MKGITNLNLRKIVISLSFVLYLFLMTFYGAAKVNAEVEYIPQNTPPTLMELAFLRELGHTILHTMNENGDRQLFYLGRIEKIVRNIESDSYDLTLRVIGYEGAINPPFKLIRITFRFPGDNYTKYSVKQYEHKYITPEEVEKLAKIDTRRD